MTGWVKIHRKMWSNPVVTKDIEHVGLWVYLITHATHQDFDTLWKGERITLHPGQLITGRKKLSTETGIDEYKVNRILKHFESAQQIAQLKSAQGSLITILAWDKYQISAQQIAQQVHNECTTSAQPLHTIQEYKEQKEQRDIHIPTNADKVGMSVKDFMRAKAKGEI